MAEKLDDVFNKIYASEQESKVQQENLADLKNRITECEKELREVEEKCTSVEEANARKVNRLSRKEVLLKTFQFRHQLLKERIRELKVEKDASKKTLAELKMKLSNIRSEFCAAADKFDEEYGFSSKSLINVQCHNYDQTMHKQDIPSVLSKSDLNQEAQTLQRDLQDFDEIGAFLFDVDFNCSQIN
ncbi:uncharacterized protein TNCV_3677261 [Trichonephila clavipes]|nr:uncharacterized protein TNCV_3677261 [Trichonephila clavipes]